MQSFSTIVSFFNLSVFRKVFSLLSKREKAAVCIFGIILLSILCWHLYIFLLKHTAIKPVAGGVYSESFVGQPQFLNPLLAQNTLDATLTHLLFASLYTYDQDGKLVPDLADSMPKISTDQKQYTVKLKENAHWHNGNQVTAEDIIFTINTLKNPEFKSPLVSLWQNTQVNKLDDFTLTFINKDISGPFIHNLTIPILPKAVWEKVPASTFSQNSLNLEAIGSGAYRIVEINRLPNGFIYSMHLSATEEYHRGKPLIQEVLFRFYKTNTEALDAFNKQEVNAYGFSPYDEDFKAFEPRSGSVLTYIPLSDYQALYFNTKKSPFNQIGLRTALLTSLDRQRISNDAFGMFADPLASPFPKGFQIRPTPISTGNSSLAKKQLQDNGWQTFLNSGKLHRRGIPLAITITTNENSYNKATAELVAQAWRDLGITVNIKTLTTTELLKQAIKPRDFDVILFAQKLGADPDPFVLWHSTQANDPGLNFTSFINSDADKLLTAARTTTESKDQTSALSEWEKIFLVESPAIILTQPKFVFSFDDKISPPKFSFLPEQSFRLANLYSWSALEKRVFSWSGK